LLHGLCEQHDGIERPLCAVSSLLDDEDPPDR
jgi:hypothetical protein